MAFAGLIALGHWQLERRVWKRGLIARVEERVHAPAIAAPAPGEWPRVDAAHDEYRNVRLVGSFLHDRETLVRATTVLGSGYWVLTPLRTSDGSMVLINRGFVPAERRERAARAAGSPSGELTVIGLLRMTEPGGAFLQRNDPTTDRWYSRDVQAIASARGLARVAPYFIDAGAAPDRRDAHGALVGPVAGLTVTAFHDNHLVYAITWFVLAAMVGGAAAQLVRIELRRRRDRSNL
jgi:surfeit locus 1 family protein